MSIQLWGWVTSRDGGIGSLAFWRRRYELHGHKFKYGLPWVAYTDEVGDDIHFRFCDCHQKWIEVARLDVRTYEFDASTLEGIAEMFTKP